MLTVPSRFLCDTGQLGNGSNLQVDSPIEIFSGKEIKRIHCGSESTMVIDEEGKCRNSVLAKHTVLSLSFGLFFHSFFLFFRQVNSGVVGGTNTEI